MKLFLSVYLDEQGREEAIEVTLSRTLEGIGELTLPLMEFSGKGAAEAYLDQATMFFQTSAESPRYFRKSIVYERI